MKIAEGLLKFLSYFSLHVPEKKVLVILNEVNATKRAVILKLEDDPHAERMKIYQRKRELEDAVAGTDSSDSDERSYQALSNRPKPKRRRPSE